MSARDFINDTMIPWLEAEIKDDVTGNKQYIAGFEAAMGAMMRFIEHYRKDWDVAD